MTRLHRRAALTAGAGLALAGHRARAGLVLRLVTGELPPYCFHVPPPNVAENGAPMGLVYDVVRAVARLVGNPETVEFMPWARAQEFAQAGPDIGILAITRTPEREPLYRWIFNVVSDDLVLVARAGTDAGDLSAFKDHPVGVLRASGAEALLRSQGFARIEPASEEWLNAQRLREGAIDAWLAPRLMVTWAWSESDGDPAGLAFGAVVRPSEIWFAGSPDIAPEIAALWARRFADLKSAGTYDAILDRYRGLEPKPRGARPNEIPWGTRG